MQIEQFLAQRRLHLAGADQQPDFRFERIVGCIGVEQSQAFDQRVDAVADRRIGKNRALQVYTG